MIVDAHFHLGPCKVFGLDFSEEEVIKTMDQYQIDTAIVQPFPGAPNPQEIHDRIANMAKQYPGRIFGIASVNPHIAKEDYVKEITRCVKELGFVGVKLHTIGHAVLPIGEDGGLIFETASKLQVPIMIHTGPGIPFSLPSLCIPRAREYPEVRIVLAHSGAGMLTVEAFVAAKECQNVFLETSWCSSDDIKWLVNELGADRVMLGSDTLSNIPVELVKYKSIGLSEEQLDKCLGETAKVYLIFSKTKKRRKSGANNGKHI